MVRLLMVRAQGLPNNVQLHEHNPNSQPGIYLSPDFLNSDVVEILGLLSLVCLYICECVTCEEEINKRKLDNVLEHMMMILFQTFLLP